MLAARANLALNIMRDNQLDALFADIDMPSVMDGIEFAKIVQTTDPQCQTLPCF